MFISPPFPMMDVTYRLHVGFVHDRSFVPEKREDTAEIL
jgi:hypothetical protein